MIKQLGKHDRLTSPFIATKQWHLFNADSQDLVLTELTGSEESVALEFVDYSTGNPFVNSECSIALEQQSSDLAIPEAGKSGSGTFFPDSEETNLKTNSFKRLIYDQIQKAFYNNYRNPIQLFGIDNIDFSLGRTDRFLGNEFLMFTIPRNVFGERLNENTIELFDHSFDDNLVISDDGYGNLVAKENLFSKVQEVRTFGNDTNSIGNCIGLLWESASNNWEDEDILWDGCIQILFCPTFGIPSDPAHLVVSSGSAILTWDDNSVNEDGFVVERSLDGITYTQYVTKSADIETHTDNNVTQSNTYWYRVFAFNDVGRSNYTNTASIFFPTSSATAPAAPSNLVVVSGSAILTWDDNSSNEDGFVIERSLNGTTFSQYVTKSANVETHTDNNVTQSNTYWYRLFAFNNVGSSSYSNTASISFVTSSNGPTPIAWWRMEESGSVDRLDAITGSNPLKQFSSPPAFGVSRATGKVGFSTQFSTTGFGSADIETTTSLAPADLSSGLHLVMWAAFDSWDTETWFYLANLIISVSGPPFFLGLQTIWQSSTNEILVVQDINNPNPADFSVPFTPTAGQFYFFNIFWRASDRKIGLQIDTGSLNLSPATGSFTGSITDTQVDILLTFNGNVGNPSTAITRMDEYGYYGKALSSNQVSYLYNSGSGRTWPFTLPG